MSKFECGSVARFAAAAGLGLTLALGAAPVVAVAEGVDERVVAPAIEEGWVASSSVQLLTEGEMSLEGDGQESTPYLVDTRDELQQALSAGGYVCLSGDITLSGQMLAVPSGVSAVLDLAGHSIVSEGADGQVLTNNGSLTIRDSGETKGSIRGGGFTLVNWNEMNLEGITVVNNSSIGVYSLRTLTVADCNLSGNTPLYITGKNGDTTYDWNVVGDISNTTISSGEASAFWGIAVLGKGISADGTYDNSTVNVTVNNCTITSGVPGQGICTNASSGSYAGFTLNVTNTKVNMGENNPDGCGLYLPGIGITTLDNCTVTAAQGIRIAAGELYVTNETAITGNASMGEEDLVPGGSGGTLGALVVGKASGGYVGDVRVYVDSTSSLNNTATEGEGVVTPAVVVSDKNMASSAYEGNTIDVVVEGDVTGDVVKTSTVDGGAATSGSDGGSTNLEVLNATIDGDVINRSSTGISLNGVTVTGDVDNVSGSTGILNSTISGTVTNGSDVNAKVTIAGSEVGELGTETSGLTVVDSTVSGSAATEMGNAVAMVDGSPYDSLQAALNAASAGDVVYMIRDVGSSTQISIPAGVTLDGNGNELSCTADIDSGGFVNITNDGVSLVNLTVNTNGRAKHGVQFYCANDGFLGNVAVNGGYWTSVLVNGSDVTLDSCTLNPMATDTESPYANIEYAMGSGVTSIPSVTVSNVLGSSASVPLVYVDGSTMERVAQNSYPAIDANDTATIVSTINRMLTGVQVYQNEAGTATSDRPSVPSNPGGSVSSGEQVKVSETDGGTVKVTPTRADEGDEVTITATPDEGQEVRSVSVVDADGKAVEVKAGEKDGEFVFEMPGSAVTVTVTFGCDGGELCPTHGFNDVDQSAWYHDAVDWAVENGVLNGYGEGGESLGPVADVTRAEMAQMLWNRAGRPEATADLSAFTDVDAGGWYAPALAWCVSEGIFSGYGDTFGTERTISREEAVTVLWRIAGSPEADADLSAFGDASKVSEYATGAVEWAVAEGVLTGKGDVALDPQAGCTRGEVAAMMMRMAQ